MTRHDPKAEAAFEWLQLREHALTVPCPPPNQYGCGQPAGSLCIARIDGAELTGPPAHHTRLREADRLAARPNGAPDDTPA